MSDGDPSEAVASTVVAVVDPRPLVRERLRTVIDGLDDVRLVGVHADWSDVPEPVDDVVVWVSPGPVLLSAARQVSLEGASVDDPASIVALLRSAGFPEGPEPHQDPTHRPLTPLEDDVLAGIARGRSAAEIATALGVSTKSVENARRRMMAKLAAGTQVEAVSRAHALRAAGIDLTGRRRQ